MMNASARDFTVNAILYDPCSQILFDYFDGLHDIQHKKLRTLGNPDKSFEEDPPRMLRAIRVAARAGEHLVVSSILLSEMSESKPCIFGSPGAHYKLFLGIKALVSECHDQRPGGLISVNRFKHPTSGWCSCANYY